MVWQALITFWDKMLIDSFRNSLTLYHMWFKSINVDTQTNTIALLF